MEELTPEWLNNEFLTDCLQNESKNANIIVTDFKVESAVPPGNNYGSIVARVKLNYKDSASSQIDHLSKTLIIKLPLTHGAIKEVFGESFDVEPTFYQRYLPKAYEILGSEFAPKYYPSSSTKAVVVLDDLKEAGFVMADRKELLDFDSCCKYADAAAAFHSGSVAVLKTHPEFIGKLCTEKIFSNGTKGTKANRNMTRYALDAMADSVLNITGDKRISSIIKECSTVLWDLLVEAVKPDGNFDTINQGDPWLTNMMFKYDDKGNCDDIKLLDFQALRFASPATDLTFFIWTSLKHNVREEKVEELIQRYVEAMNCHLEVMECCDRRLSLEFFKKEMLRVSPIALYVCSACLPFIQQEEGLNANGFYAQCKLEYSPDKNPYKELFNEYFCENNLVRLVNQMEKLKIFDYLEVCLGKKENNV